ncbi:MAG: ACP S-malonyltransferase [Caldisericia bacterium]
MKGFIFPGQGSQYKGMGRIILSKYEDGFKFLKVAQKILNMDLEYLLLDADDEELKDTENAQISILLTSYIHFKYLEKNGLTPDYVAGHSLGEYSALLCAGSLSFEDALIVVRERARTMKRFIGNIKGVQVAILNLKIEDIEDIVNILQDKGVIQIAGYNSKTQTVLSLEENLLESLKIIVSENKGRLIPLKTSLPFHSPLMQRAEDEFRKILANFRFSKPKYGYISSVINQEVSDGNLIKEILFTQITRPVKWMQTILRLQEFGVKNFYEVGPNKVLTNLGSRDFGDLIFMNSESLFEEERYERV